MTAEAAEPDDAHISFAKRLAHNNKETRSSALRKLKRWLVTKSKQGTLDDGEIIKIWKGLHYSMWYSDKPLVQEALALDISQIVALMPDTEDSVKFFGGFCQTIAREWVLIDKLRLDKFYMFIRTALKSVLEFCADKSWNEEIVGNVVLELENTIINSESCPSSISVYISEHFLALYSNVATACTPPLLITKLLMSYITTLAMTPKKDLSRVIMTNLFDPITKKNVNVRLDLQMLNAHIQQLAVNPCILTRNRKLLYKLRNDLTIAIEGDLSDLSPLGKHKLETNTIQNSVTPEDNSLINGVVADDCGPTKKKKKRKKEIKSISENGDPAIAAELSNGSAVGVAMEKEVIGSAGSEKQPGTESKVKKKKNKKNKVSTDDSVPDDFPQETQSDLLDSDVATATKLQNCHAECSNTPGLAESSVESVPILLEISSSLVPSINGVSGEEGTVDTMDSTVAPVDTASTYEDIKKSGDQDGSPNNSDEVSSTTLQQTSSKPDETTSSTPDKDSLDTETSSHDLETPTSSTEDASSSTPLLETVNVSVDRQPVAEPITKLPTTPPPTTPSASKSPVRRKSERKKRMKSVEETPTVITSTPNTVALTPCDASSVTKKKVRMSMENNQTFFFKKNASMESPAPYDSTRTPSKGVLKTSPAVTRSRTKQGRGRSRVRK